MIEGPGSKIGDPGWKIEDRGWRIGQGWRIVDRGWRIEVCGWSPAVSHLHGFGTDRQPRMRKTRPHSTKPTNGRWCVAGEVKISNKSCSKKFGSGRRRSASFSSRCCGPLDSHGHSTHSVAGLTTSASSRYERAVHKLVTPNCKWWSALKHFISHT